MLGLNTSYYSESEYSAYRLMTLGIILALIHQTWQSEMLGPIQLGLTLMVLCVCGAAIVKIQKIHTLPEPVKVWKKMIIYFLIVGILHFGGIDLNIFSWAITQDLRYCILFLAGGCFAISYKSMSYFHYIMKILALLSIFAGIYSFLHLDLSIASIETRTNTWSLSYLLWWVPGSCFLYWGYYVLIMKKDKILGYSALLFYTMLGVLFLKRGTVVDVAVIFAVAFFLSKGNKDFHLMKIIVGLVVVLGIMYIFIPGIFNSVWNMVFARFDDISDVEEMDRAIEFTAFFEQAPLFSLIFGNGIGHYFSITGTGIIDRMVNALHSGWANIIYKGGIVYLIFYIYLYKSIFKNTIGRPLSDYEKVCLGVAISHLISLIYGGSWTYTITPFGIAAPLFFIASSHSDEDPKIYF